MLGVANIGKRAGMSPRTIFVDLRTKADEGNRVVSDREILDAIQKAFDPWISYLHDKQPRNRKTVAPLRRNHKCPVQHKKKVTPQEAHEARLKIHHGRTVGETDLIRRSPVPIPEVKWEQNLQASTLFKTIYEGNDRIFVGNKYASHPPFSAHKLTKGFSRAGPSRLTEEFLIPNPVSGELSLTSTGKLSYRANGCIQYARFVVVEFDNISLTEQLALWGWIALPICVLVTSGGKSIHAWIDLRTYAEDPRGLSVFEWDPVVTNSLKPMLTSLGADPATFHQNRLSRLSGQFRKDKNSFQRLLYLNPKPSIKPIMEP